MLNCVNKLTGKEYEIIQYNGNRQEVIEVIGFIREHLSVPIRVVQPKVFVLGLEYENFDTEININDYLMRTKTNGMPSYRVVSKDIMEQNFIIQ